MVEVYEETCFDVHDPVTARQVALFFNEDDAKAYQAWRCGAERPAGPVSEQEWLGNTVPASDGSWGRLDGILDDVWHEIERLSWDNHGIRYAPVYRLQKFIDEYRIRLGLEHGRITAGKAREMLGVPEWAR